MNYSTQVHENYGILHLQEERLNSSVAPELKSALIMFNTQGRRNIILDLSEVKSMDSSGLSVLMRVNSLCVGAGGIFVIFGLNPHVQELITILQLDRVFNILPSQQEAIKVVLMHETESQSKAEGDEG